MEDKVKTDRNHFIMDNGGLPYKVNISENNKQTKVMVYKNIYIDSDDEVNSDDEDFKFETEPILTYFPQEVLIGYSSKIEMTIMENSFDSDKTNGNSILLYMGDKNYIFIGPTIYSFKSLSKITNFLSPIGSSSITWPYAIDEHSNYYLLKSKVILLNYANREYINTYDLPYNYYYDYHLITPDYSCTEPKKPKCVFKDIVKFYTTNNDEIDDEEDYTMLTYEPFPMQCNYLKKKNMFIVDSNGKKTIVTSNDIIELMNEFGKMNCFTPLVVYIIHDER